MLAPLKPFGRDFNPFPADDGAAKVALDTEPGGGAFSASAQNVTALDVDITAFLERLGLGAGDEVTPSSLFITVIATTPTLISLSLAAAPLLGAPLALAARDVEAGVTDAGGGAADAFHASGCAVSP